MYAEEFILVPRKTYAPDEKTAPQSQVLHNPLINDKTYQLNYIQRFRERNISRDSPPPLSPTSSIPLTPSNVYQIFEKKIYLNILISVVMVMMKQKKMLNHTIFCSRQVQRE